MLLKSLEFKNVVGQKVKVMDIPVLEEDSTYKFMIQIRLEKFISSIYREKTPKKCYSFKEYLKKVMKWPDYEQLFKVGELKNNA
nr:YpmP family protein [Neobacillus sp. Marseille-Q6967]